MDLTKLKGHVPDSVIAQLPDTMAKFEINTPLRLAHFLAQAGHESGNFRLVKENLNYSAKGLNGIFKKYFPTLESALPYERKPEKIANKVYANRMGNGDEASGDGAKHCGRGFIQLTGKTNYQTFFKSIGLPVDSDPNLVATQYPLFSAAWFWNKNGLNKISDQGSTDLVVTQNTKKVNGGTIGLDDRIKHFKEFFAILA